MNRFLQLGLIFFSAIGVGMAFLLSVIQVNPLTLCGKSCRITEALINIFGFQSTGLLLAFLWLIGSAIFAWLAIQKKKSN